MDQIDQHQPKLVVESSSSLNLTESLPIKKTDSQVQTPQKKQDLNYSHSQKDFKSPKSSPRKLTPKISLFIDKQAQVQRDQIHSKDFLTQNKSLLEPQNGKPAVLSVHQSQLSFGDHCWPSPAHTNLGSHIQTLQAENPEDDCRQIDEERRKNLFTSPLLINNAHVQTGWSFTPKSIEKQTSDILQKNIPATLRISGPSHQSDHNLIDNGSSVLTKTLLVYSDEKLNRNNFYFPLEHGQHDQPISAFEYGQQNFNSDRLLFESVRGNSKLAYSSRHNQSLIPYYVQPPPQGHSNHHYPLEVMQYHPVGGLSHPYYPPSQMYMHHHQHYYAPRTRQIPHNGYYHSNCTKGHSYNHAQPIAHYPYLTSFYPHHGHYPHLSLSKNRNNLCTCQHHSTETPETQKVTQQLTKTQTMHGANQTLTLSRSVTHTVAHQTPTTSEPSRAYNQPIDRLYTKKEKLQSPTPQSVQKSDTVSKKLDMQLSDTKTMLPHDIYREQAQCEQKNERLNKSSSNSQQQKPQQLVKAVELKQQTVSAFKQSQTPNISQQRRGYYLNQETGRFERIIRKRKRKSGDQLQNLNKYFEENPHWSKETLQTISYKTGLSEGQVYKWGWDQKRKKFGIEEAERMRHIEHQMDQANAARRQQLQLKGQTHEMNNLVLLNDLENQEYSENSEEFSNNDVSKSSDEQMRYQTPIQPSGTSRRDIDSAKQKQLLSTQPQTVQKDKKVLTDCENMRKRDLKLKRKGHDLSPKVQVFTGKDKQNVQIMEKTKKVLDIQKEALQKKIEMERVDGDKKISRQLRSRQNL